MNRQKEIDLNVWRNYENGYASDYTEKTISNLDCSDEMKNLIRRHIENNRAGGELYSNTGVEHGTFVVGNNWIDCW